ncbi:MAG TPA: hypothetical protein VMM36_07655 [Opitutaceae bacterium]|nr:hypothetical protein [Opitutaceae bacterium]
MKKSQGAKAPWGMAVFAAVLCALLCARASATTVVAPEFEELVNVSDCVVRAVVKSVRSEFSRPGGKSIVTYVELEVKEVITGNPPSPLVLRMLGGRVGDKRMVVSGAPEFVVGDEDILFIRDNGKVFNPLTALMHGRYPIARDKATGRGYMMRNNRAPLKGTREVSGKMDHGAHAAGEHGEAHREPALTEVMSPEDFAAAIRAAVKPGSRRPNEK